MDKKKKRTDLLAAGREKLQQFRQKKDGKGGSSGQGKSSKKSGKSKKDEPDADVASAADKQTGIPDVPAEEVASSLDTGPLVGELLASHHAENSAPPEISISDPISETSKVENIDSAIESLKVRENEADSLVSNNMENLSASDVEVAGSTASEVPKFRDSEVDIVSTSIPTSVDSQVSPGSTNTTERGFTTDATKSMNREEELLHSSEVSSDVPSVQGPGDQVADDANGSESNQVNKSNQPELDEDSRVDESAEIFDSATSNISPEEEATKPIEKEDDSVAGVVPSFDGASLSEPETDGKSGVISEAASQQMNDIVVGSSIEEMSVLPSESSDCIKSTELIAQVNAMGPEVHNQENISDWSTMSDDKTDDKSLDSKTMTYTDSSKSKPSTTNLSSISLPELSELIKGLGVDEYRFLLNSRVPMSPAAVRNIADYGLSDALERLKEELVISNSVQGIFGLQLAEQSELEKVFDQQRHGFIDEISRLKTSLHEVREENGNLSEELMRCKSELKTVTGGREDLQHQFYAAKVEIEELSARALELEAALVRSQEDLSSLSSEFADCKNLVAALQSENESLNRTLASVHDERKNLAEEKDCLIQENENLSTKLASLQLDISNLTGVLASEREERKNIEEEKDNLAHEIEKTLSELAEYKGLVMDLRVENDSLVGIVSIVKEEKRKLEEDRESIAYENDKLSSELLILQEQLNREIDERMHFEGELEKATSCIERLTEQNLLLNISLDIQRAELNEIDSWETQRASGNQVEYAGLQRAQFIDDQSSGRMFSKESAELFPSSLDQSSSDGLQKVPVAQIHRQESLNEISGFVVLEGRLEAAENILLMLEQEVDSMHAHLVSLSKTASKVAAPGVSKLIQAFESKVHIDGQEERASMEDILPSDPYPSTKEQSGRLRSLLRQLRMDVENVGMLFKGEQEARNANASAVRELNVQYEDLKEHSTSLEANNIELGVLYETVKHYVSEVENKNNEVKVLCESLKQEDIRSKAENRELSVKLDASQLRIRELEIQLDELQHSSDEKISSISRQLEITQKESSDGVLQLEKEWGSTVSRLVETMKNFDESIGAFSPHNVSDITHNPDDIVGRTAASAYAATKVIECLWEKLQAAGVAHEVLSRSCDELNERFNILHVKSEGNISVLQRLHAEIRALFIGSYGLEEERKMNAHNEELLNPADFSYFDPLLGQIKRSMDEKRQLLSVNNQLNSEVKELNENCLDVHALHDIINDVVAVIKLEGSAFESDEPPILHLKSILSLLVQKFKETDEQLNLSMRECESKVIESSKMQEKMEDLNAMRLQQENEVLILTESLRQAESALVASCSKLQEKVTELDQSEQRVSSLREKLSIAVAKGKNLIVQRDGLKQSLAETSNELRRCSEELHVKEARLCEVEQKLKAYSEAGERVEALESELSYIRNSATALRESFLLKDSVLQRIEEILEDLDLPEHFHSRGIIEKISWLARSATGNSVPLADWDQKSSVEGGSYSNAGFAASEAWRDDGQPGSSSGDDLRRRFEDLQGKFYGLAEQNEMLEQSLMERNNLVQRWEELLDRINMPPQLRSMEPVDRIEWLGAALSEAYHERTTQQEKIDNLESYCLSVSSDLDESKRHLADLESDLREIAHEKELLSERLLILIGDREKLSETAVHLEVEKETLLDEVAQLQKRLAEKLGIEECMLGIEQDIRKLQNLIMDACHDPGLTDMASEGSSIACLEALLRKLIESYVVLSSMKPVPGDEVDEQHGAKDISTFYTAGTRDTLSSEDTNFVALKKELEESLCELGNAKDERDSYLEKQQSLTCEVDALNSKVMELQALLSQEEQKTASVREKLNVAVRKGKSLVQQRDSLKQTIEEMNNEVERLKSDLNRHVNSLAEHEQKVKMLSAYPERLEAMEAENLFLRNRLAETEQYLQDKSHMLSTVLHALDNTDFGNKIKISDPVEKLERIELLCHESHAEAVKSKRAAELLLAELNEVQERNDGLQEDLDRAAIELEEHSRARNEAEAAKLEAFARLEKLSTARDEERKNQFSQLMQLKSGIEQLMKGLSDINNQLPYVFSRNLEFLHKMEACLESYLKPGLATGVLSLPIVHPLEGFSENKENLQFLESWPDSHGQDLFDDNVVIEVCSDVGRYLKEIMTEVFSLKGNLQTFSISLHEQTTTLSKAMGIVHGEVNSQQESFEAMKRSIAQYESDLNEKNSEINALQRYMSLLYEACATSVSEIENRKAEMVGNSSVTRDVEMTLNADSLADRLISGHATMMSEVESMGERLRKAVRELASMNSETLEGGQKEMKITIANLQKELQERDIQRDKICTELVGQIKEAEAAANSYFAELQSSKSHLNELENQVRAMEEERDVLKQRVNELQDQQETSKELRDKVKSLTEAVAAKEEEIESLMQALDEEEAQMEDLKNKVQELEKVVQQKDLDLENLVVSHGKVAKKLSVTVAKFDELHHLSASLLTEVENLQSQLQDKDAEISFLRQEVTRCTNDVLVTSQMSSKSTDEILEILTWLDTKISVMGEHDVNAEHKDSDQIHELKEKLQKKITSLLSELVDLRVVVQSKDAMLQVERGRVEELTRKEEMLEKSLHEKESELGVLEDAGDSGRATGATSEIVEVEPVINKWTVSGTSGATQVRSLRKVNNDQVAIAIDTNPDSSNQLTDEDDDKVHGFKSLTRSRIIPRFTRPVTDMIDGLWVSCDRALMRHPTLRLGIIIYWAILHALLATYVV